MKCSGLLTYRTRGEVSGDQGLHFDLDDFLQRQNMNERYGFGAAGFRADAAVDTGRRNESSTQRAPSLLMRNTPVMGKANCER